MASMRPKMAWSIRVRNAAPTLPGLALENSLWTSVGSCRKLEL